MAFDLHLRLSEPDDPASASGYPDHPPRVGFFTDTSICIGCKACEVACKEWNAVPTDPLAFTGMSYDNTVGLGANTWRHVAFIEQRPGSTHLGAPAPATTTPGTSGPDAADGAAAPDAAGQGTAAPGTAGHGAAAPGAPAVPGAESSGVDTAGGADGMGFRWLMSSDVCKHCTNAACLDVCPTGALVRTEFGTVVVQEDVCNGCGYCVPACPYGVIDQRQGDGRVFKCTMCYDRLGAGQEPACAHTCPTKSIQFGELDQLRVTAAHRVQQLHDAGVAGARLYGADPDDGVGGAGAFFLLLDEPEVYGLPPDPVVTTRDLPSMWRHVAVAAVGLLAGIAAATWGGRP